MDTMYVWSFPASSLFPHNKFLILSLVAVFNLENNGVILQDFKNQNPGILAKISGPPHKKNISDFRTYLPKITQYCGKKSRLCRAYLESQYVLHIAFMSSIGQARTRYPTYSHPLRPPLPASLRTNITTRNHYTPLHSYNDSSKWEKKINSMVD